MTRVTGKDEHLGPWDVHIWYRDTESLGSLDIELAGAHLSNEERACCNRFHLEHDRRDYTIAHDLVRRSLSRYSAVPPANWQFDVSTKGKPFILNSDALLDASDTTRCRLSFNLSHTRGLVACAIARYVKLGLDVERIDRAVSVREIAQRHFCPRELAALHECRDDEQAVRFCELWTLKEAFVKATGAGLSDPLTAVCFEFITDGDILSSSASVNIESWRFALFAPSRHTRMAVAACKVGCDEPRFSARLAEGGADFPIRSIRTTVA